MAPVRACRGVTRTRAAHHFAAVQFDDRQSAVDRRLAANGNSLRVELR